MRRMHCGGFSKATGKEGKMSDFKVGIIGVGHVGAHVLYTLCMQGLAEDILLCDLPENRRKVESERQDVLDCTEYLPHRVKIEIGEIEDLGDRDLIINAVGDIIMLKGTHTRLSEMEFNMHAIRTYADRLKQSGFGGILVNISNPCDVITKQLADMLGLPAGHVFGTGTGLDTARLKIRLQERTGIDAHSISAYMIGEHGNEQITPWSAVNFNGLSLDAAEQLDPERFGFDRDEMEKSAREGGWVTYNGKFCTEYAIALTAARLVKAVRFDEQLIVPASAKLEGQYGEEGLFIGVPARIGRDGLEEVIELPLTAAEKKRFHSCCEGVRQNLEASEQMQ